MNRWMKKIISLALIFSMVLPQFSTVSRATEPETMAEDTKEVTDSIVTESVTQWENADQEDVTIVREEIFLRKEFEKHYLQSDGTYRVVLFDEPVHKRQDGEWVEIDNTLQLKTQTDGTQRYATTNGIAQVSFAKTFEERLVTMRQDDYEISWGVKPITAPNAATKVTAASQTGLVQLELEEMDTQQSLTASKSISAVKYRNGLQQNVDLEYIVLPSKVKENIILNTPQDITGYSVTFYTENLTARVLENRQIEFCNSENSVVFIVHSPYMYDNAGELSEDIDVELVSEGRGIYTVKMIPDQQWLNNQDRVYPVVIDPVVSPSNAQQNIIDNYVLEGSGVQNNNLDRLYIGNKSGSIARAYIKFAQMPTIPTGSTIVSGAIVVQLLNGTSSANNINAYKVTGGDWSSSTITWANKPAAATLLAYNVGHNDKTFYSISCKAAIQSWYSGNTTGTNQNYGVMLRYTTETISDYNSVYSADYSDATKRPLLAITYNPPTSSHCIQEGKQYTFPAPNASGTVIWASSNTTVATVNTLGTVTALKAGEVTISATVNGTVYQHYKVYVAIEDGVYYLNSNVNLYLGTGGGINDNTSVRLYSKSTSGITQLRQLWKVTYLSDGYYSVRPMHKLDMTLTRSGDSTVINEVGTTDTFSSMPEASRCRISYGNSGYMIRFYGQGSTAMKPVDGTVSPGMGVTFATYSSSQPAFRWYLEKLENPPSGVLLYDKQTGAIINGTIRTVSYQESIPFSDLNIIPAVYGGDVTSQTVTWTATPPTLLQVESSTGNITVTAPGLTNIVATASQGSTYIRLHVVTDVTMLAYTGDGERREVYFEPADEALGSSLPVRYHQAFEEMEKTRLIALMQSTSFLIIETHGQQNQIILGEQVLTVDDLSGVDLSELDFVLLMCCWNGLGGCSDANVANGTPTNIVEALVCCGVKTVVGFSNEIPTPLCEPFITTIMGHLANGYTMENAIATMQDNTIGINALLNCIVLGGDGDQTLS